MDQKVDIVLHTNRPFLELCLNENIIRSAQYVLQKISDCVRNTDNSVIGCNYSQWSNKEIAYYTFVTQIFSLNS